MADDAASYDLFGTSVSISGDMLLVGANSDDDNGTNSGSAYLYSTSDGLDWSQEAKLVASNGRALDQFGMSVALQDGVAVIGAPSDDDDAASNEGSAYVFTRYGDTWLQSDQLFGSGSHKPNQFGFDVAIDGNTLL
ncbi:MAG: FG-GAP repeat protein, partial [Planctomycetota bacterium]